MNALAFGVGPRFLAAAKTGLRESVVSEACTEAEVWRLAGTAQPQLVFLGTQAGGNLAELCVRLRDVLPGIPIVVVAPAGMSDAGRTALFEIRADAILGEDADALEIARLARTLARAPEPGSYPDQEATDILHQFFEAEPDAVLLVDNEHGQILEANAAAAALYGYAREELLRLCLTDISAEPDRTVEVMRNTPAGSVVQTSRLQRRKDGTVLPVRISARFFVLRGRPVHVAAIRDHSAMRQREDEREATIRVLFAATSGNDLEGFIRDLTAVLQEWSGCESVGVRVQDGSDFPYFATIGFPSRFVALENSLCATDSTGELLRDSTGDPILECMCGNVIRGRVDPAKPYFTAGGSFWTNSTSRLLATTNVRDGQTRSRNRCTGEGYESVALIPLRASGRTFGLLQFNDHRENRFSPERIDTLERLSASISVALEQRITLKALHESERRQRAIIASAMDGFWCADLQGRLLEVNDTLTAA